MYNALLRIKHIREQRTNSAKQQAIKALQHAQLALQEAQQSRDQYHHWQQEEQERLFAELMGNIVPLQTLEDTNHEVGLLVQKAVQLDEKVIEEKKLLEEAKNHVSLTTKKHQQALKAVDKFDYLCEQEAHQQHIEAIKSEDNAQDELSNKIMAIG